MLLRQWASVLLRDPDGERCGEGFEVQCPVRWQLDGDMRRGGVPERVECDGGGEGAGDDGEASGVLPAQGMLQLYCFGIIIAPQCGVYLASEHQLSRKLRGLLLDEGLLRCGYGEWEWLQVRRQFTDDGRATRFESVQCGVLGEHEGVLRREWQDVGVCDGYVERGWERKPQELGADE